MTIPPLATIPPLPLPATKSQLSRLGDRLAAGTPAEGDKELYLAFLNAYDRVQGALVMGLREFDWQGYLPFLRSPMDIVGRTKTRDTLVQKLRREPGTKLPYVRDVAGVRMVGDMTLTDQSMIANLLTKQLARGRVIDRLDDPRQGYRALHAVIKVAGLPVEVQIRTRPQHVWAETFERLADRWGRQIRYGEPPDDPQAPGSDDDGNSFQARVAVIRQLQQLSVGWLADLEQLLTQIAALQAGATEEGPVGEAVRKVAPVKRLPPEEAAALRDRLEQVTAPAREARRQVEQQLLDLVTSLDNGPLLLPDPDIVEEP